MRKALQNTLLLVLGWFFVLVGVIGIFLPILPTTPFLIVALALFSKSSPRFHRMLLNNRWVGPPLRQWEETKSLPRKIKVRASLLIVVTFSVSIAIFSYDIRIQLLLVTVAIVLLFFLWRIRESN